MWKPAVMRLGTVAALALGVTLLAAPAQATTGDFAGFTYYAHYPHAGFTWVKDGGTVTTQRQHEAVVQCPTDAEGPACKDAVRLVYKGYRSEWRWYNGRVWNLAAMALLKPCAPNHDAAANCYYESLRVPGFTAVQWNGVTYFAQDSTRPAA